MQLKETSFFMSKQNSRREKIPTLLVLLSLLINDHLFSGESLNDTRLPSSIPASSMLKAYVPCTVQQETALPQVRIGNDLVVVLVLPGFTTSALTSIPRLRKLYTKLKIVQQAGPQGYATSDIGVRANFFSRGGVRHLCPKNFLTAREKTAMLTCKITFATHPTQ